MGFQPIGERTLYAGHVISLADVEVEVPTGERIHRDVVRHPGAVVVLPLTDHRSVVLVRQYRTAVDQVLLEAPAGTRDVVGEPPEETARRELAEEAGLTAVRLEKLAICLNSPGYSDQETTIFLATGLAACESAPAGVEEQYMTVDEVPLAAVGDYIARGELRDAMTILALSLATPHQGPSTQGPSTQGPSTQGPSTLPR